MNAATPRSGGKPLLGCALAVVLLLVTQSVQAWPDLALGKTGPAQAAAGSVITYTLSYSNIGEVTATNVVLTDFLPGHLSVLTNTLNGGSVATNTIFWNIG